MNKNYYYNIFLEKGSYKDKLIHTIFKWMFVYYKCYVSIELTFPKELILIKQVHQKSVIFVTIGISYIKVLSFNQMPAIDAMIY